MLSHKILLSWQILIWTGKKGVHKYAFKNYFEDMNSILNDVDLVKLVKFPTWSRAVNGVHRKSLLDHV